MHRQGCSKGSKYTIFIFYLSVLFGGLVVGTGRLSNQPVYVGQRRCKVSIVPAPVVYDIEGVKMDATPLV